MQKCDLSERIYRHFEEKLLTLSQEAVLLAEKQSTEPQTEQVSEGMVGQVAGGAMWEAVHTGTEERNRTFPGGSGLSAQTPISAGSAPFSYLVALSGGRDSVSLLYLTVLFVQKHGGRVEAMHMNHNIRGEEAGRDEQFCRTLCARWGVVCHVEKRDIPTLSGRRKQGLEECAREERYKAAECIATQRRLRFILTAHNSDDQAETMLFRMGRGCSLKGLCGIPEIRENILRPMLDLSKAEITAYLAEQQIPFVEDSTNGQIRYARNRLRWQAIPALKEACPGALENMGTLSRLLREDEQFISSFLPKGMPDLQALSQLHPAVLRRYLAEKYREHLRKEEKEGQIGWAHLEPLCRKILNKESGFSVSLPGRVKVTVNRSGAYFIGDKMPKEEYACRLRPGKNQVPGTNYLVYLTNKEIFDEFFLKKEKIHNLFIKVFCNSDKIEDGFYMRTRKPGDTIRFGGMTRQLSKLIATKEKDPTKRACYPVICDEEGILWVPGYPIRQGYPTGEGDLELIRRRSGEEDSKDWNKTAVMYIWIEEQLS